VTILHVGLLTLSIDNYDIDNVQQVTDLGVCIDSQLNFTDHVANWAVKGHRMANLILKCFKSRDSWVFSPGIYYLCSSALGVLFHCMEFSSGEEY